MITTIVDRYVFRQTAGALSLILLSLSGVLWIAIALRQLNVVTSQGQDVWRLVQMTTLALPNLIAVIAPFALLIATLHVLNRLNSDSELIVLTASGATVSTISRPLVALALVVALGVGLAAHYAMPWSLRQLREYIIAMRTDLLTQVIQPGRFTSPETGLTFHIRERSFDGELRGLIMHDTRDPKSPTSFLAERGEIVKQGASAYLVMSDGHIVRRPDPADGGQVIAFQRYTLDLEQFETKVSESSDLRPRERYWDELVNPGDSEAFRLEPGKFRSEIHDRLSAPLYPIAFVLIALATVGRAQSTRQGRTQWLVAGFVAGTTMRLFGLATANLVTANAAYVPLVYAIPGAAIVASLAVLVLPGISFGPRRRVAAGRGT